MGAVLTNDEKARIRYYLGYPNTKEGFALAYGIPATYEYGYVLEPAMDSLKPEAASKVREILTTLDNIEKTMQDSLDLLLVSRIGELSMRTGRNGESTHDLLRKERASWAMKLATIFAVRLGPFFADDGTSRAGSIPRFIR